MQLLEVVTWDPILKANRPASCHGNSTEENSPMKERFTKEQIVRILREVHIPGVQIREVCRKHNVTHPDSQGWRWRRCGWHPADAESAAIASRLGLGNGIDDGCRVRYAD
jgi:hypothetical protein